MAADHFRQSDCCLSQGGRLAIVVHTAAMAGVDQQAVRHFHQVVGSAARLAQFWFRCLASRYSLLLARAPAALRVAYLAVGPFGLLLRAAAFRILEPDSSAPLRPFAERPARDFELAMDASEFRTHRMFPGAKCRGHLHNTAAV
jgi:hypothetical protein